MLISLNHHILIVLQNSEIFCHVNKSLDLFRNRFLLMYAIPPLLSSSIPNVIIFKFYIKWILLIFKLLSEISKLNTHSVQNTTKC